MPATAIAAAKTPPTGMTTLPATPEELDAPDALADFVELPEDVPVVEEAVVVAVPVEVLVAKVEPVEEPVSLAN